MKDLSKMELFRKLKYVFSNLIEKDEYIISHNAHEQCLSGRLAMYLREALIDYEKNYNIVIDVEYNRDHENVKTLDPSNPNSGNIRPDILFHTRDAYDNDLIYCEVKKNDDNVADLSKVRVQVTNDRHYKFGIAITHITKDYVSFQLLERGNIDFQEYKYDYRSNEITETTNE